MSPAIRRMVFMIRRELFAYVFFALTLRWIWQHGLDKWSTIFGLLTIGVHPGMNKTIIAGSRGPGAQESSDSAGLAEKPTGSE